MSLLKGLANIILIYFVGLYTFLTYELFFRHPSPLTDIGNFIVGALCIVIIFFGIKLDNNTSADTNNKYITLFYIFSMIAVVLFCLTLVDMFEATPLNRTYLIRTWLLLGWVPAILQVVYFATKVRTVKK